MGNTQEAGFVNFEVFLLNLRIISNTEACQIMRSASP